MKFFDALFKDRFSFIDLLLAVLFTPLIFDRSQSFLAWVFFVLTLAVLAFVRWCRTVK